MKVKVIFLDCDGVLNTSNPDDYDREMKNTRDYADCYLPRCVTRLNHITDKTGAKIVVSSTWRLGESAGSMQRIFSEMGITGQVIDLTPTSNSIRGLEIKNWLEHKAKDAGYSVESYVILDDDCDMLYEQRNNFILVDPYSGITPRTAYTAIRILGEGPESLFDDWPIEE